VGEIRLKPLGARIDEHCACAVLWWVYVLKYAYTHTKWCV
jgi:hypothetical protein